MIKNKQNIMLLGIILIVIIFLFLFFWNRINDDPDIIIGYSADSFGHSPIFIGKELGLFEAQGLKVKYIAFTSTNYSRQAISTGQVDIVTGGANNFIDPISKGINIRFIAPMVLAPSYAYVRPNDVNTLLDLNNTSIATRVDSTTGYAFRRILKENNLDINFTYVDIENAYSPIALMDKKIISAALKGAEAKEDFFKAGAIVLPEWVSKGYTERYFLSTSIIVNEDFASRNPEIINKFLDGYIESQRFMKENPKETKVILANYMNNATDGVTSYSVEDISNTLSSLRFVLWVNPNEFLDIASYAYDSGIISNDLNLTEIYDNRYEEKLRIAQEEIYE